MTERLHNWAVGGVLASVVLFLMSAAYIFGRLSGIEARLSQLPPPWLTKQVDGNSEKVEAIQERVRLLELGRQ